MKEEFQIYYILKKINRIKIFSESDTGGYCSDYGNISGTGIKNGKKDIRKVTAALSDLTALQKT